MSRDDELKEKLADVFGLEGDDRDTALECGADVEFPVHESYGEDAITVVPGKEPGTAVVGYLSHDDDAADFFENDDGAGEFKEFRAESERDAFVAE